MNLPLFATGRILIKNLTIYSGICLLLLAGCGGGEADIPYEDVEVRLKVHRLHDDMYRATQDIRQNQADSLAVYREYFVQHRDFITDWMFYGNDSIATDSILTVMMYEFVNDPNGQQLLDTLHTAFEAQGFDPKNVLTEPMQRFKYYFPNKALPSFVTFVDGYPQTAQQGIDQIFISPRYFGIGMHYFMGPEFKYYPPDLPKYIRRRCTVEHLPSLVVHKLADVMIPKPDLSTNPVLLDFIVHEGIKLYFVDKVLGPQVHDSLKIFYDATQIEWANAWEAKAYSDMVDQLYEINPDLMRRYVDDSPFTSQLNRKSAPRLGQFIGWKIVTAYMANNLDVQLDGLVRQTDYKAIFQQAKYRPRQKG